MQMNHKIVNNQCGGLIYFFSREYSESSSEIDMSDDAIYSRIVFIDNVEESIIPYFQSMSFPGKIDVCFCDVNTKGVIDALHLRENNKIHDIVITPNCIYSLRDTSFLLGYENWNNSWAPDALQPFDMSAQRVLDIYDLVEQAGNIANTIASSKPTSDLEKIVLTDAWIQKNIQYATGKESSADGGIYVCESIKKDSNVHDPFLHGFGRCEDIALVATLILEHPALGVHCRQVRVSRNDEFNHSWNIVTCNGKEYYTDFTHNITKNPNRAIGALRATSYSYQFTLLGIEDAADKYGTTVFYKNKTISPSSLDREEIETAIQRLKHRGVIETSWNSKPIIPSYFVKKL